MAHPRIVDAAAWQQERDALLLEEKELTRALDALAARRRRLPMVRFDPTIPFEGPDGTRTLLELFDGRSQLAMYHFMYGPDWDEPCPGCSNMTDGVPEHLERLHSKDITWVNVSRAPSTKIEALKAQRRWTMPWFSSGATSFNEDLGLMPEGRDMFGLSLFLRVDDEVFRTWFTQVRGVDRLVFAHNIADLAPLGRQEDWEDSPDGWPQHPTYG